MDALAAYGSDEDAPALLSGRVLDTAPAVNTTGLALVSAGGVAGQGIVVPVAATKNLHGARRAAARARLRGLWTRV
jgi:hypothetical protein